MNPFDVANSVANSGGVIAAGSEQLHDPGLNALWAYANEERSEYLLRRERVVASLNLRGRLVCNCCSQRGHQLLQIRAEPLPHVIDCTLREAPAIFCEQVPRMPEVRRALVRRA